MLPTEDHAAYLRFRDALVANLKPEGQIELMLAQNICDAQHRLERAHKAEANVLSLVHCEGLPPHIAAIEDSAERDA